jgi:hypothetical protein
MRLLRQRGNDFIASWANGNRFHRWLSQRQTIFRVCSASFQILTVFIWTSGCKLSHHGTNSIAVWVNAKTISSLTELSRKRFYRWMSQHGNGFIADWANGEMTPRIISKKITYNTIEHCPETNFTGPTQIFFLHPTSRLSSEFVIYEFLTASIHSFLARS